MANHPRFSGKSVRGTGIMMTLPGEQTIELRWEKKFVLSGSVFDSDLHWRRPVEPRNVVREDT